MSISSSRSVLAFGSPDRFDGIEVIGYPSEILQQVDRLLSSFEYDIKDFKNFVIWKGLSYSSVIDRNGLVHVNEKTKETYLYYYFMDMATITLRLFIHRENAGIITASSNKQSKSPYIELELSGYIDNKKFLFLYDDYKGLRSEALLKLKYERVA